MHRRRIALAGHVAEQRRHRCEARGAAQDLGERKPLRREQVERGAICGRVDAECPDDPKLLVDDEVGVEARYLA